MKSLISATVTCLAVASASAVVDPKALHATYLAGLEAILVSGDEAEIRVGLASLSDEANLLERIEKCSSYGLWLVQDQEQGDYCSSKPSMQSLNLGRKERKCENKDGMAWDDDNNDCLDIKTFTKRCEAVGGKAKIDDKDEEYYCKREDKTPMKPLILGRKGEKCEKKDGMVWDEFIDECVDEKYFKMRCESRGGKTKVDEKEGELYCKLDDKKLMVSMAADDGPEEFFLAFAAATETA